jgi:hypothetical protein
VWYTCSSTLAFHSLDKSHSSTFSCSGNIQIQQKRTMGGNHVAGSRS